MNAKRSYPPFVEDPAEAYFVVNLKVGRMLSGRCLVAAVGARNLAIVLASLFFLDATDLFAPEWVLIQDQKTGKVMKRLSVGRGGDGMALFEVVHKSLGELTRDDFVERWDLRG